MLGQKKSLKKITLATGVVAMTIGLASAFSFDAKARTGATGGGDRYYALGEDGTHICKCDTSGTKCVCL